MTYSGIYLDYQATTPVDQRVLDAMIPYFTENYGNPSSAHQLGNQVRGDIRKARRELRDLIGARYESEVIFTSGATEADHLAICGVAEALRQHGDHIVTTAIEHKAVLSTCEALAQRGFHVTYVPVSSEGIVSAAAVEAALTDRTILVSVMHANNEIGTVQPLAEISRATHRRGVLLHTDAAQSLGSADFDVDRLGVDLASFSAHKIYGPKGVGALYVRRGRVRLVPQFVGGGQEYDLRAGTQNVPGIIGLGRAATLLARQRESDSQRILRLRGRMIAGLTALLPDLTVNGSTTHRLPGNISITVPGLDADRLVAELPEVAISTGSACNTGQSKPSHVLTAIGLDPAAARATLRIGIGRTTTVDEVDRAVRVIASHVSSAVFAA